MAKIRIYDPKNGKQLGLNTDHVSRFFVDNLVNREGERVSGFCLHVYTIDEKEFKVYHDRGGLELLEVLETEFFPMNKPPDVTGEAES